MPTRDAKATCPPPLPTASTRMLDDGIRMLRELIRLDTTNPPGNESIAANRAAEWLAEVGIESAFADASPGRRNLVASIGPASPCVAISAHLDVVPADPAMWTHPPFEAVEADGCIWGRGAIDMKHMAAFGLAILRELARNQADGAPPLARGLKLLLFADEEAGCEQGSLFIARKYPEWLAADYALTEVGGFTMWVEGERVYPIQVAEKGFAWLRLRIHGEPGHGSMPHRKNAIVQLADIVQQLAEQPFPYRCTQPVADFLTGVAEVMGFPKGQVFRALGRPALTQFVLERLVRDEERIRPLSAMLRHTVSPTVAHAGTKSNVIPGDAELVVDCRILPGTQPDEFVREFRQRIRGNYDIEIIQQGPPVVMDRSHPAVDAMRRVLQLADPGCHPVTNLLTGFTDARAFDEVGTPCFGFSPIWLPPDIPFAAMFHGHNERIPVDGFRWGLATLHELICREMASDSAANRSASASTG